jgi:hypothetical protein
VHIDHGSLGLSGRLAGACVRHELKVIIYSNSSCTDGDDKTRPRMLVATLDAVAKA